MTNVMNRAYSRLDVTDFGPQGGDPQRRVEGIDLDLSTCVNRYGPPPAVRGALAALSNEELQIHPYAAAAEVERAYSAALGVEAAELVAGRGTTEFIWALGRRVAHRDVAVPLPAYTDYLRAFPGRGFRSGTSSTVVPSVELVDAAMARARLVILSNPHNPSGVFINPRALQAVAARHRHATLVVDESYVEFLPDPDVSTVIGSPLDNVVTLRSPSKFYGIAATRVGVAWCRDRARLEDLLGTRETWPVSGLDAAVALAAIADRVWADRARRQLVADGAWLAARLRAASLDVVEKGVAVHYRCVVSRRPEELAESFAREGIGVRSLGAAHGVDPGAVRILAPRCSERALVGPVVDGLDSAGR